MWSAASNRGLQPSSGIGPVPIGGGWRDAQHFGRLIAGQSGKVTQLDELGLERIGRSQLLKRLVEGEKLIIRLGSSDRVEIVANPVSAAFLRLPPPRTFDQNAAH